jgi:large subunit ribosomal protein L6
MKSNNNSYSQLSVPNGVKIEKKKDFLIFSGPLGLTKVEYTKIDPTGIGGIHLSKDEKTLIIYSESKSFKASLISLLKNKIRGVSVGFLISLRIVGVGYRASLEKNFSKTVLHFKLGYSHNLKYILPESIRAFLLEPSLLCLFGVDKNQVSQLGSKIRNFKVPERYKGKGIRFTNEKVALSQGKRK